LGLSSATLVSQCLGLCAVPLITRLYSPEDFGVFAIFSGSLAIAVPFLSLRYENAILHSRKITDAVKLVKICFYVATLNITLLSILLYLTNLKIKYFNSTLVISAAIFLQGFYAILQNLCYRFKKYNLVTRNILLVTIVNVVLSITFGYLGLKNSNGLVLANTFSNLIGLAFFIFVWKKLRFFGKFTSYISVLKLYEAYPKKDLLACTANLLSQNGPSIVLSQFFSTKILGDYFLNQRLLNVLTSVIIDPITILFRNEALAEQDKTKQFNCTFKSTFKILVLISLSVLFLSKISGEHLFTFVFGQKWKDSFIFFQIVIYMFVVKMIVSPLSASMFLTNNQSQNTLGQTIILFSSILSMAIGISFQSFMYFVVSNTVLLSISYIAYLIFCYRLSKRNLS